MPAGEIVIRFGLRDVWLPGTAIQIGISWGPILLISVLPTLRNAPVQARRRCARAVQSIPGPSCPTATLRMASFLPAPRSFTLYPPRLSTEPMPWADDGGDLWVVIRANASLSTQSWKWSGSSRRVVVIASGIRAPWRNGAWQSLDLEPRDRHVASLLAMTTSNDSTFLDMAVALPGAGRLLWQVPHFSAAPRPPHHGTGVCSPLQVAVRSSDSRAPVLTTQPPRITSPRMVATRARLIANTKE